MLAWPNMDHEVPKNQAEELGIGGAATTGGVRSRMAVSSATLSLMVQPLVGLL
jgi:hypothetical protein